MRWALTLRGPILISRGYSNLYSTNTTINIHQKLIFTNNILLFTSEIWDTTNIYLKLTEVTIQIINRNQVEIWTIPPLPFFHQTYLSTTALLIVELIEKVYLVPAYELVFCHTWTVVFFCTDLLSKLVRGTQLLHASECPCLQ